MLSVYTRHYPPCLHTDIHYRRCRCPKWIRGPLEAQGLIRKSAKTRNWSKAERLARELERRAEFPGVIEVKEAVRAYLADQAARKLSPPTLTPIRALFERRFLPWCEAHQLARLDAIRTPQLKDFRSTWECNARTARRRHERLRSFFAFCMSNGWLLTNPTDGLKKPIAPRTVPTDYFNRREFQRILGATYEYQYHGRDCHQRAARLRALFCSCVGAVWLLRMRLPSNARGSMSVATCSSVAPKPARPSMFHCLPLLFQLCDNYHPPVPPTFSGVAWASPTTPSRRTNAACESSSVSLIYAARMAIPSRVAPTCFETPSPLSCC